MSDVDAQKRAAAEAAGGTRRDGMALGLGSGSTMIFAVQALASRVREELQFAAWRPRCAPRSRREASAFLLHSASVTGLDLAIDGADEVEAGTLRLIKGLGGALLREKIVSEAARRFVVVADASKVVKRLASTPLCRSRWRALAMK